MYNKYQEGQTIYYPTSRYYSIDGVEHLEFNPQSYEWNAQTLNCTDPKFICTREEDCKKLCDLINQINGY